MTCCQNKRLKCRLGVISKILQCCHSDDCEIIPYAGSHNGPGTFECAISRGACHMLESEKKCHGLQSTILNYAYAVKTATRTQKRILKIHLFMIEAAILAINAFDQLYYTVS